MRSKNSWRRSKPERLTRLRTLSKLADRNNSLPLVDASQAKMRVDLDAAFEAKSLTLALVDLDTRAGWNSANSR